MVNVADQIVSPGNARARYVSLLDVMEAHVQMELVWVPIVPSQLVLAPDAPTGFVSPLLASHQDVLVLNVVATDNVQVLIA